MNRKYSKGSLEALVQKAGVISRELDGKLERMEALGARVDGQAVAVRGLVDEARRWAVAAREDVRRKVRWLLWVDVPLCVLLVVDVVLRWC